MSNTWFSSDWHIGHANILEYSHRPFKFIADHNDALVENFNAVVKPGDRVYMLGDFCLGTEELAVRFAKQLNGQKFFIWGNHDKRLRRSKEFISQWIWCKDLDSIEVNGQKIVLCHYAMLTWNQSHRGSWNLHGHSHGSLKDDPNQRRTDVGVDCWGMNPVEFDELKTLMDARNFKPIDHHGE